MSLNCINNEQFINNSVDFIINYYKIKIKLNTSEYFEAFDIYRDFFIDEKLFLNMQLTSDILTLKSDRDIKLFWEALLYYWENKKLCLEFKEKLQVIENFNERTFIIMESVFKKNLDEISKGHY